MRFDDHYLRSQPVTLHWAGWTTDTFRLQQAGWSLSAQQDPYRNQMSIALRNERAGIAGITGAVDWHFMGHAGDPFGGRTRLPDLPVRLMARQIEVMHTMGNHWDNFAAIDAQPQMYQQERRRLEDFVHFAPAHTRTQQLIVPEDTVDDLMARIIEMQQGPRIERIRQEIAEGEKVRFTDRQKFHAQIISLAA